MDHICVSLQRGHSLLHEAISMGQTAVVTLLMEHGADQDEVGLYNIIHLQRSN